MLKQPVGHVVIPYVGLPPRRQDRYRCGRRRFGGLAGSTRWVRRRDLRWPRWPRGARCVDRHGFLPVGFHRPSVRPTPPWPEPRGAAEDHRARDDPVRQLGVCGSRPRRSQRTAQWCVSISPRSAAAGCTPSWYTPAPVSGRSNPRGAPTQPVSRSAFVFLQDRGRRLCLGSRHERHHHGDSDWHCAVEELGTKRHMPSPSGRRSWPSPAVSTSTTATSRARATGAA